MARRSAIQMCFALTVIAAAGGAALAQGDASGASGFLLEALNGTRDWFTSHRGDVVAFLWWELIPLVLVNLVFLFFLEVAGMHPSRAVRVAYALFVMGSYAVYHMLFRPPIQSYRLWVIWGLLGAAIIGLLLKLPRSGWQRSWISKEG